MSRIRWTALCGAALISFSTSTSQACDLCSIYTAVNSSQPTPNTFRFGLAEQFTSQGKVQEDGHYVPNVAHQHMESSITQLYGSYSLSDSFELQANLPYINRRFKRIEGGEMDEGTEAGVGDLSILAKYIPYQYRENETIFFVQLLGGIKLATGDSDRIKEELSEDHHHGEEEVQEDHEEHMHSAILRHEGHDHDEESVESAVHGHDLALGSGSYDFPVGFNIFAEQGKAFLSGGLQYVFRTEGDFNYEYADDLTWEVGPGYYFLLGHDYTVALKANLSGEYKRKDELNGAKQDDTAIRSTFLGPELVASIGNWNGELAWDVPMTIDNSSFQTVPEYKLRAAVSYRF